MIDTDNKVKALRIRLELLLGPRRILEQHEYEHFFIAVQKYGKEEFQHGLLQGVADASELFVSGIAGDNCVTALQSRAYNDGHQAGYDKRTKEVKNGFSDREKSLEWQDKHKMQEEINILKDENIELYSENMRLRQQRETLRKLFSEHNRRQQA